MSTCHLASDHAATELKEFLKNSLISAGHEVRDLGPFSIDRVDYPDYAKLVCDAVLQNPGHFGILLCGSGIGMSIAANKIPGIRAAHVQDPLSASLSRQHNDATVLCLGARILGPELALACVQNFLAATFEGGRHKDRIAKIHALEPGTP